MNLTPDQVLNNIILYIVNPLLILLFAVTALYFVWGIYKFYIAGGAEPANRAQGSRHVLAGLIGMAIMVAVFALIHFIARSIGVTTPSTLPQ